jgi:hypothetical protein
MYRPTLDLDCHVRSGANAVVRVSVDRINYEFELTPTINWVPSSSPTGTHKISLDIKLTTPVANTNAYDVALKIQAQGSDVLVCGYSMSQGQFQITGQPVWNVPGWRPYDISGHQGDGAQYQGNGSLQILNGQTVEFSGTITMPTTS